jgi:plasmid stabilization system protein ParE
VTYRFEISDRARADADEAYAWLAERSPEQAERWYRGLFDQVAILTAHPLRCPLAAENDKFPEEIREGLYGKRRNTYRVIFTIRDDTVVVLYIRHGARDAIEP